MVRLWFEFGTIILVALAVEFGLMSTTTSRETAVAYSGKDGQRCTVLEITAGRVDVGADIGFLSQYPGEEEFLMQPLACLEARKKSFVDIESSTGSSVFTKIRFPAQSHHDADHQKYASTE
jgi:hypothetical protein